MAIREFPVQWQALLKNGGEWRGSFTRFDPKGVLIEDTPTTVTLEALDGGTTMSQVNRYYHPDGSLRDEKFFQYSSLSRTILFFDNGAFSQGALQLAPFAEFGAEFGFLAGQRRLRLVLLYDVDNQVSRITLIREQLADSDERESAPLTVDALVGQWEGDAIVLKNHHYTAEHTLTWLRIDRSGDQLTQHLQSGTLDLRSTARIEDSMLDFGEVRVLLLPGGASCTFPGVARLGRPFFIEAGWLVAPGQRQRLIRHYNGKGEWTSLTLVSEQKIIRD